jgi:hypothetical protein
VGAFLVVDRDPVVSYFSDLIQIFKEIGIQDFMPIGAVKALDKSVLARFAGLDITQLYSPVLAPLSHYRTA